MDSPLLRFLPVVDRELRVTVRHPKTWWRRVVTVGVAIAVFAFVYVGLGQWATANRLGGEIFAAMTFLGVIFALLAGPLATVDCLSRERREGTLGLLFLTDLRGYDVVLGKMAAASLDLTLGLAAALPLMAVPLLLGGVTLAQFWHVALALLDIMFLSLAIGVLASATLTSGRSSLVLSVCILFFLTLAVPFLGEVMFKISSTSTTAAFYYMACPLWLMGLCLDVSPRAALWKYWLNVGGIHSLAWICLGIACRRIANAWRDLPASPTLLRWRTRVERWRNGSSRLRRNWRRFMLDHNPVAWLEGRDWLQERVLTCLLATSAGFWAIQHGRSPALWPSADWVFGWPVMAHYALCAWIAIQAPRRLADDKQSGALELLLCTLVSPRQIVGGCMSILRRRFGRALLALLALDAFLIYAYYSEQGGWQKFRHDEVVKFALCGALVFPLQAYSLARIGIYQGLVSGSLRATFMILWKVGLLPWVLFLTFILTWNIARFRLKSMPAINDTIGFGSWIGFHLFCCAIFLAHAQSHLLRNFRSLAAITTRRPWWKRVVGLVPNSNRSLVG